jgi:hypothetical protein
MPSAVVFICVYVLRLCPPDVGDIVRDWSWDWDRVAVLVVHGEVASPIDKLLAALWNRDAHKVAKENPPLPIAVVLTDDAKRILMGREGDLLVAFVVDYSKSVGESELDCYFA